MRKITPQTLKLLIVKFAGTFGSGMLSFAIGLYILRQTGSALSMGVSMITGPIVALVLTPFVGFIIDTMSHRLIMICAQVVTSVALIVFGIIFHTWPAQYYPELIGLIIALQVTDNFLSTTLTASIAQLFKGEELQQVNSLNQSMTSLASFLAPIIGALVYTLVSIDTFAYIEVIFELLALVAIMGLKFKYVDTSATDKPVVKPTVITNFREGLAYLVHQKLLFILTISSAAINFMFAALNVGLPFLLVHTLKLSNTQYGTIDSAFAVGMFIGGALLSQLHLKRHPVTIAYLNLMVLAGVLIFFGLPTLTGWSTTVNTIYFIGLSTIKGMVIVFINTPINTFMQQVITQRMQGRVFSLDSTISTILAPVGTVIYGILFDHFASLPIFAISGIILLGMTLSVMLYIMRSTLLTSMDKQENAQ